MRTLTRVAAGILVAGLGALFVTGARAAPPTLFTPHERAGMMKAARAIETGRSVDDALDGYALEGLVAAGDRIGDAHLVDVVDGASVLRDSAASGVGPTITAGLALARAMRVGSDADGVREAVGAWRTEWGKWPGRPK